MAKLVVLETNQSILDGYYQLSGEATFDFELEFLSPRKLKCKYTWANDYYMAPLTVEWVVNWDIHTTLGHQVSFTLFLD